MIVVIGTPVYRPEGPGEQPGAAGLAAAIARAAASLGASVQLVAKVGDDPAGDAVLAALARDGVGHAAVSRDPAAITQAVRPSPASASTPALAPAPPQAAIPALDPADLDLALRYLADFRVLVIVDALPGPTLDAAAGAAAFAGAHSIVLVGASDRVELSWAGTVLVRPRADPDASFARLVARYAAGIDGGRQPGEAFTAAVTAGGWEQAGAGDTGV